MAAAASIRPGWKRQDLKYWDPIAEKPQLDHLKAAAKERAAACNTELKCSQWNKVQLVEWLEKHDVPQKKRWSEFFWGNGRGRCAVDLRKECAVSRIACIYVGAWAVCSPVGASRAGVTVVSRAHTTACPHATAGRRPESCIYLAPSEIYVYIWV